jgi:hypothetical protein
VTGLSHLTPVPQWADVTAGAATGFLKEALVYCGVIRKVLGQPPEVAQDTEFHELEEKKEFLE